MGWFKNIFKSSESRKTEAALEDFDGYLTVNSLAINATEVLVEKLEDAGYSATKIKKIVRERKPEIIKLVQKNRNILETAEVMADRVIEKREDSEEFVKSVKNKIKDKGEKSEESEIKEEIRALTQKIENMGSKEKASKA